MLVSDSSGFLPVTGLEGCQKVSVLLQCLIAEGVGAFLKQEIDHVDDVLIEDIVVRGQALMTRLFFDCIRMNSWNL